MNPVYEWDAVKVAGLNEHVNKACLWYKSASQCVLKSYPRVTVWDTQLLLADWTEETQEVTPVAAFSPVI